MATNLRRPLHSEPIRTRIHHEIRDIESIAHLNTSLLHASLLLLLLSASQFSSCPAVGVNGARACSTDSSDRQARHVEEVKHIQVLQLVRGGCSGRRGANAEAAALRATALLGLHAALLLCAVTGPNQLWLARDEKVEVKRAATHVREDLDSTGCSPLAVDVCGTVLAGAILVQHTLEQGGVALGNAPVGSQLSQSLDKRVDGGVNMMLDGGTMDEKDASGDP